jgi:hypothetical protein
MTSNPASQPGGLSERKPGDGKLTGERGRPADSKRAKLAGDDWLLLTV